MENITLLQMIRDLLDKNDQNQNPLSIITQVSMIFVDDKPVITIETILNEHFELSINKMEKF